MIPDREVLWMILSGVLVVWIFWMDLRPTIYGWLEARSGLRAVHLAAFAKLWKDPSGNIHYETGENIRQLKQIEDGSFLAEFQRPVHRPSLGLKRNGVDVPLLEKTRLRAKFKTEIGLREEVMMEFECEYRDES